MDLESRSCAVVSQEPNFNPMDFVLLRDRFEKCVNWENSEPGPFNTMKRLLYLLPRPISSIAPGLKFTIGLNRATNVTRIEAYLKQS